MVDMNATANTTTAMDTNNNPWVESGAMVYVAITVATMSAVIMCCTWFITHNTALQRWWHGAPQYGGLDDEEEEIELIDESITEESATSLANLSSYTDESEGVSTMQPVFTLDDNSSESESEDTNGQIDAV